MPHPDYCSASVPNGGLRGSFRQCSRKIQVTVEGKGYCYQHAPGAVQARREQQTQRVNYEVGMIYWQSEKQNLEQRVIERAITWERSPDPQYEAQLCRAVRALIVHENKKPAQEEALST